MPPKKSKSTGGGGAKKAKRTGSNVFEAFSEKQVAEFKEGFQFMDRDKDGVIGDTDIKSVCDDVGRVTNDAEVNQMLADAPGPITFTQLINMFSTRQQGGASDEDDVVAEAFKAFAEDDGMIDSEKFKSVMTTFGEKYSDREMDEFFDQVEMDDNGRFSCNSTIEMITGKGDEEAPPPPPPQDE